MAALTMAPLGTDGRLAALLSELDPGGRHGERKVAAALKAVGLEPRDVDPAHAMHQVHIIHKIPDAKKVETVRQRRGEVFEGLRQSRLEEVQNILEGMGSEDVRRYERAGEGVRAIRESDLPPADSLAGMDDFHEMQARQQARLKAEQQRKASLLVTGFLQEKKRMEDADAKIAAVEKRMIETAKQREGELKLKRAETMKKLERRQAQIDRAAKERDEWELETEAKLAEKLDRAGRARVQAMTRTDLHEKIEAANSKRADIFRKAEQLEESMLQRIAQKQDALDERLDERHVRLAEQRRVRAEIMQARFHDRQLRIYAAEEEFADTKLSKHREFQEHHKKCNDASKANLQMKSKSCGDITRKAHDKWRSNYDKEMKRMHESHETILNKHQVAEERVEKLTPLKLKCGNDVHTNMEVKYNTWGELQRRRHKQLTRSRDAHMQALIFEIAEQDRKAKVQWDAHREMERRRQQTAKDSLTLKDHAKEGFLKIQCEPDERKIHATMTNLGFTMPTLPDEEEEQAQEESKQAY